MACGGAATASTSTRATTAEKLGTFFREASAYLLPQCSEPVVLRRTRVCRQEGSFFPLVEVQDASLRVLQRRRVRDLESDESGRGEHDRQPLDAVVLHQHHEGNDGQRREGGGNGEACEAVAGLADIDLAGSVALQGCEANRL